ncbi:hypothetical protein D3C71_1136570 [compost metagenome]
MRKAGLHHHAPALGAQLGNLLGPEVTKVRLLRQRPHGAQRGGCGAVAPLQLVRIDGDQAQIPHAVHGVGLGAQVALHAHNRAAGVEQVLHGARARVEDGGGGRRLPVGAIISAVGPVNLHQRHAVAARPQLALGRHAQQAVASAQGHEGDARAEVAAGYARVVGAFGGRAVGLNRLVGRVVAQQSHYACGFRITQGR